MKRIVYLICFVLCILGCNKNPVNESQAGIEEQAIGEEVIVSLGLGGEISVSETPLSKTAGTETSSTDLYGINVYYDKEGDGIINDHYAYGLFDNVADMIITLVTGHKYKFECRMLVDGKDKCSVLSADGIRLFSYPFSANTSSVRCSNQFIYGKYYFTDDFKMGGTYYSGYLADTYYGEVTDYSPKAGGSVNIDMKRCVYGLTINLSGLSKGSVTFNYNPKSLGHSESYETTVNGTVFSDIISFCYTYECWLKSFTDEDYSKTVNLEVIWAYTYEGTNATDSFQKTESITLKRNVMTTVNINLDINTKDQTENSFNLTRSETTMGSEEYDYNYTISLNGTVDNPVNP